MSTTQKKKRFKRREPWPKLAQRHGVTDRTLDRWAARGIIDPPEYIQGRKFGDPDSPPRLDTSPPDNPQNRDPARRRLASGVADS
jgi:hypothetical protein